MENIVPIDLSKFILSIKNDKLVQANEIEFGTQKNSKGINVGLVNLEKSPPHNGECHNDGDEIIIVVDGIIAVESDSNPDSCLKLQAGDSCIIRKGEWHKINVIEKAKLVYITSGLNNEYRF